MNYIIKHWQGKISLGYAYWLNGVLLSVLISKLYNILFFDLTYHAEFHPQIVALAFAFLSTTVSIWAHVGIWRSAGVSMQRARDSNPKKFPLWAYLARASVILYFLMLISIIVLIFIVIGLDLYKEPSL